MVADITAAFGECSRVTARFNEVYWSSDNNRCGLVHSLEVDKDVATRGRSRRLSHHVPWPVLLP